MKHEFEKMVGQEVGEDEYACIETVYMFYPGEIQKDTIVKMYKESGMVIFRDLYKRASEIVVLNNQISDLQNRLSKLFA